MKDGINFTTSPGASWIQNLTICKYYIFYSFYFDECGIFIADQFSPEALPVVTGA
jgi:hypothetical protein